MFTKPIGHHSSSVKLTLPGSGSEPGQAWHFPTGFLWGAATSSHQVEGNNRWNDWWEYEQSGRLPYASGEACHHYELYERDFDLARSWGHNAHRFSLEWSRIEPAEGQWSRDALEHYRAVIGALKRRGLEPIVTLHHFTNPAWFTRSGGWSRQDSATVFARYIRCVAKELGEGVRFWLTINEPTVYVMQGYINGEWPPFLTTSWIKAAVVLTNLARAHRLAYRLLHQLCADVKVGFAHSAPLVMPCNPDRMLDRGAAYFRDFFLNRAFFLLIGGHRERKARCLDYIGINYYTRALISSVGWGARAFLGQTCHFDHHNDSGAISDTGWEVYPIGLRLVLERFSRLGIPVFVTENGIATNDESLRREFIIQHLERLAEACQAGANVIGYLYWSLMDNYEWTMGTEPHFGLAAVDPITHERRERPCVQAFQRFVGDRSSERL
jgi:beta-glucosidase